MISGTPQDKVIAIDANSSYEFSADVNMILSQEPLFYINTCFIDAHTWRAILLKHEISVEVE